MSDRRASALAARVCALAATAPPGFCWLDGAASDVAGGVPRGLLAAWPDDEVVGESLSVLGDVQDQWRARPQARWIGWLSYELGAADVLGRPVRRSGLPGLCLRRFGGVVELRADGSLRGIGDASRIERALQSAPELPEIGGSSWPLQPLVVGIAPDEHRRRVVAAKERIAAGDTYQVNLSQPMHAAWSDQARVLPSRTRSALAYAALRRRFPAAMGGLIETPIGTIVSNSPETLLRTEHGAGVDEGVLARSWPIKGTRPRGREPADDRALIDALRASDKDAAEHVMIVDLVRNDLGRLAIPGSVSAPRRPSLLTLPTVHHLVTEVRATLRPDVDLVELVRALFPGGSITGAPKRSTVEIIDGLEEHPRGIYCGGLILLEPTGVTLSIAIRTGVCNDEGLTLCSGGGIVIDSDPEAERRETLDKAAAFSGASPSRELRTGRGP